MPLISYTHNKELLTCHNKGTTSPECHQHCSLPRSLSYKYTCRLWIMIITTHREENHVPVSLLFALFAFRTSWSSVHTTFSFSSPLFTDRCVGVCVKNVLNYTTRKKIFPIFFQQKRKPKIERRKNPGFPFNIKTFQFLSMFWRFILIPFKSGCQKSKLSVT